MTPYVTPQQIFNDVVRHYLVEGNIPGEEFPWAARPSSVSALDSFLEPQLFDLELQPAGGEPFSVEQVETATLLGAVLSDPGLRRSEPDTRRELLRTALLRYAEEHGLDAALLPS